MSPLKVLWEAVAPALPPALTIVATVAAALVARVILRRVAKTREGLPFRRQIASSLIVLAGIFAFVVSLPIAREIRSQILSVLGVLLSAVVALSSTSFVGNAMAGLMLRIVRGYRPGDFVQVGEVFGRVSDQGLFHTEIQTISRDLVTVPNLYMTRHPLHVTRSAGTFVSAKLSLGYDVPHEDAERLLIAAAEACELGEPFVMVNEILDHAIEYEIFGLLEDTKYLLTSRSALRKAVLDAFHGAGIEVLSPQFVTRRELDSSERIAPKPATAEEAVGEPAGQSPGEQSEQASPDRSGEASTGVGRTGQTSAEELAFDKAEEAESIERLKSLQDRLIRERDELQSQLKEAEDREEKDGLRRRAEDHKEKIERVGELIENREAERDEEEGAD